MSGTYLKTSEGERRVSFSHGDYVRPRLLPGQSKLLLNSRRGGRPGIWIEDIEGDARERICDGDQASVSSDGRLIVFRREGIIVRRELSSGIEKTVSPAGWSSCSFPSFHPDGRVLFVSPGRGTYTAYLADPRQHASPEFLFDGEIRSTPRSAPDGRTIAYQNGAHIYLFDVHAKSHRRLTFAGGVQSWPMWSEDGESIAYLQSPTPVDGPRHVYRLQLDNPQKVFLVLRDVELGPDWNGLGFATGVPSILNGGRVNFWQSEEAARFPPELGTLMKREQGWRDFSPNGGRVNGDVIVECEWGALYLSAATGKLLLIPQKDETLAQGTEIRLLDRRGRQAERIASIDVSEPTVDRVPIAAVFRSDRAGPIRAAFSVSRSRPFVEIKATRNLGGVLIKKRLELAVVPDRVANDLIYHPANQAPSGVSLPRAPFVLGMAADKSGLLMVVTPAREQTVRLVKDNERAGFLGVEAYCAGESVFVSVLPGDDRWRTTQVTADGDGQPWQVVWSNPFPAQWRLATQGDDRNFALMSMMDTPTREKSIPLEEAKGLTTAPRRAIIYSYGRSQNTPLDRMTPMDVLHDALGIEHTSALLDIEGIRSYRHAEAWVPYKDPKVALEILTWIRRRDRPGVRQKIDDVSDDILMSLQGLDMRLSEYEAFATHLERMCRQRAPSGRAQAFLEFVDGRLAQLHQQLSGGAITPLAAVAASAQAFRSNRAGGYDALRRLVMAALSERLQVLAAYRELAKSVRDTAGLAVAHLPEARNICEQVRGLSGQVLRKRCYLEGDWRGEQPLGGPEVPYEKISDL